jgi:DNA-binding response OmpR family regulator
VHILLATDADWIVDEVTAALGGPDTSFTVCRDGRSVADLVADRQPDMVITDLQVGSMGGMAISLALRNDESVNDSLRMPVLMLLDRQADVYLAQRSQADAWLIKPLDALRLKRAAVAAVDRSGLFEGVPDEPATHDETGDHPGDTTDPGSADSETGHSPEEQPTTAG